MSIGDQTWGEYGGSVLNRLSPKVVVPFVIALIGIAVHWAITGEFNHTETLGLITAFVYGVVGLAVPPAKFVTQAEVEAYSRVKRARRA